MFDLFLHGCVYWFVWLLAPAYDEFCGCTEILCFVSFDMRADGGWFVGLVMRVFVKLDLVFAGVGVGF